MGNCKKEIKVNESYVSFKNIDCFENVCVVIDHLLKTVNRPENKNAYWDNFINRIPEAYYVRDPKKDPSEKLLYLVCSNITNIAELFETAGDEDAVFSLEKCEQECC